MRLIPRGIFLIVRVDEKKKLLYNYVGKCLSSAAFMTAVKGGYI